MTSFVGRAGRPVEVVEVTWRGRRKRGVHAGEGVVLGPQQGWSARPGARGGSGSPGPAGSPGRSGRRSRKPRVCRPPDRGDLESWSVHRVREAAAFEVEAELAQTPRGPVGELHHRAGQEPVAIGVIPEPYVGVDARNHRSRSSGRGCCRAAQRPGPPGGSRQGRRVWTAGPAGTGTGAGDWEAGRGHGRGNHRSVRNRTGTANPDGFWNAVTRDGHSVSPFAGGPPRPRAEQVLRGRRCR